MAKKQNYSKPEASLRDYVAGHLSLIEIGLTLVQTEFPLPNSEGARGFIDILARDMFGHRVVIEIKRSDATARQALHELHKYVELLQKNQGLTNAEVRCILISTDWHELRVPFGAFQRTAKYPVDGYEVVLVNGEPSRLQRVEPVSAPSPLRPFRVHHAFLFATEKARLAFLSKLTTGLEKVGVSSAVILSMSVKEGRPQIVYPYCLYLMICDISAQTRKWAVERAREEVADPSSEEDIEYRAEEEVVCEVIDAAGEGWDDSECSSPEKIGVEMSGWNVEKIARTGRLINNEIVTDNDIYEHLTGNTGTGYVSYDGIGSPAFPAAWNATKTNVLRCLTGNELWAKVAKYAFKLIEETGGRTTATFHLYNPCDTVMMLYQLHGNDDPGFVPAMKIIWRREGENTIHFVSGVIGWDGKSMPSHPKELFSGIFGGEAFNYFIARNVGEIVHFDKRVMKSQGLSYHAAHFVSQDGKDVGFWCATRKGEVVERPLTVREPIPLQDFLDQNSGYLGHLVQWIRSVSSGI